MGVKVYRGIDFTEACEVLKHQCYASEERKRFVSGIAANAVFGSGLYLVSDLLVAIEYAFCHAEASNQKAAVLRQDLTMRNPVLLQGREGEGILRTKALDWRYPYGCSSMLNSDAPRQEYILWSGNLIKEYLLAQGHDGIEYTLQDHFRYYVSYYPSEQVSNIELELSFDIEELQYKEEDAI